MYFIYYSFKIVESFAYVDYEEIDLDYFVEMFPH